MYSSPFFISDWQLFPFPVLLGNNIMYLSLMDYIVWYAWFRKRQVVGTCSIFFSISMKLFPKFDDFPRSSMKRYQWNKKTIRIRIVKFYNANRKNLNELQLWLVFFSDRWIVPGKCQGCFIFQIIALMPSFSSYST